MTYTTAQTDRIEFLASTIAASPIPMAVCDYAGRFDGDGKITADSPRRFGTRDLRHVAIYKLDVVRFNPAARDANRAAA
jgi:hypothetical protein